MWSVTIFARLYLPLYPGLGGVYPRPDGWEVWPRTISIFFAGILWRSRSLRVVTPT